MALPACRVVAGAVLSAALCLGLALMPRVAEAQMFGSGAPAVPGGGSTFGHGRPAFGNRERPPPAALPGAQAAGKVAPAEQPMSAMDPTAALFDAINRGDIAAARDAVGRGADLNGHDVLGMTPLELSIDLSRNDITFLLLSSGAASGGGNGGPPGTLAASGKPSVPNLPASSASPRRPATKAARAQSRRPTREVAAPAAAAPQTPVLFAGNGGTPVPSAGFLGFTPGR